MEQLVWQKRWLVSNLKDYRRFKYAVIVGIAAYSLNYEIIKDFGFTYCFAGLNCKLGVY